MNNNGFFSVYALLWLNIVCACALLLITAAAALLNAKQEMKPYDAQIVAVYHTKQRMKQMKQCFIEAQRQTQNQTDTTKETENETENIAENEIDCISKDEIYHYKGVTVHAAYEENSCTICLDDKQLKLYYDIESLSIIDLVYSSLNRP